MNIEEMLKEFKFEDILVEYYESAKRQKLNKKSKYSKRLTQLLGVYYASFNLGYYINCVFFGNKILCELNKISFSYKDKQTIYHIYFESLLYCYVNKVDISEYINLSVSNEIKKIAKHALVLNNPDNNELLSIYDDYNNGNLPYYTLNFLLPYPPLFKNYTFDLSKCFPYVSLTIKEFPRVLDDGIIQDYFTSVEFKVYGFTHKSSLWMGDDWEKREKLPHIKKCLPILNMLFLYAGNSTKTFVPTICIEQVSSTKITQFTYDGKMVTNSMGTDFRTHWVGLNVPKHEYTMDELYQLNEWLVQSYGSECFISLFQQAKNNISAGMYVESFLLLCSCSESMIYYWCRRLCMALGIANLYEEFSKSRISSCDKCKLFLNSTEHEKPHFGMEPSLFQHINYIVDKCKLSNKQEKELKKLISKVRNDGLRNAVVHGRTNNVSLSVVNQSIETLMELQDLFLCIEREIKQKHS